jgi:hypothetical protein
MPQMIRFEWLYFRRRIWWWRSSQVYNLIVLGALRLRVIFVAVLFLAVGPVLVVVLVVVRVSKQVSHKQHQPIAAQTPVVVLLLHRLACK